MDSSIDPSGFTVDLRGDRQVSGLGPSAVIATLLLLNAVGVVALILIALR